MISQKRFVLVGVVGVLLSLVFGNVDIALSAASDWDQVVAKARKEGQVVLYGTMGEERAFPAIAKIMQEKYGIRAEEVRLRGGQSIAKMKAEAAAKTPIGSFMCSGASVPLSNMELWQPIGELPELVDPKAKWGIDPHAFGKNVLSVALSPTGIIINTKLIPKGTEPKSWKDLADPKWRGKYVIQDPRKEGLPPALFSFLVPLYGEEWYKKVLIDNKPNISREGKWVTPELVRGEYPMLIAGLYRYLHVILLEDPKVAAKFYIPVEGCYSSFTTFALLKNAPHPNAARVFLNVALSMEGQKQIAEEGYIPVRSGTKVQFPQFQSPENIKQLKPYPPPIEYLTTKPKETMKLSEKLMGNK